MEQLKREIALNQYDVDAGLVADAILSKLRLVKRARLALSEADRNRSLQAGPRRAS